MRLLYTLKDQSKAVLLSTYLFQLGIDNQLEIATNADWGSPDYGTVACTLWTVEEDQYEQALSVAKHFVENPDDPRYREPPTEPINSEHLKLTQTPLSQQGEVISGQSIPVPKVRQPIGFVTLYLLIICSLFLLVGEVTSPTIKTMPPGIPYPPLLSPPINKTLMYDYPKAYEIIDTIVDNYGVEALQKPDILPKAGKDLLNEFNRTPYWRGMYEKFVKHIKQPDTPWDFNAPLFEKEKQGEFWRLFTPCLLHSDLFHLFFNMIWLVVLGRQMEHRIGKRKYIFFIIFAALVTNTAQYFMSGSNFLGFSGVLCAMITFIWVRQKRAAWEGYQLERGTLSFITFFILFMLSIQVISFFLESYADTTLPIGIANTAHLTGGVIGIILARMNIFAWK